MMNQRLQHDCAWACATALLDMACSALLSNEHKAFHEEAYHIVLAALEAYDIHRERTVIRIDKPSRN